MAIDDRKSSRLTVSADISTLVFTPTEASWLNLIEPHFGTLKRATLPGSDDSVRRRRIYRALRLRHWSLGNAGIR